MIKAVTVINGRGEDLRLELADPWSSGIVVQSIDGLGPAKATIHTSSLATMDGDIYNSARVGSRNIVLELKFLWDPDIETVRQRTYRYFPIKQLIYLIIETDNRTLETYGLVESNEPSIFSSEEGTKISILCPDAYFVGIDPWLTTAVTLSSNEPMFEFVVEDPKAASPTINFGELSFGEPKVLTYYGDAPTGITVNMHFNGPVTGLAIYSMMTHETMSINDTILASIAGSGFVTGDDLVIKTSKGQKSAYLIRDGVQINILNALGTDISWFTISNGDNIFAYTATSGATSVICTISYQTLYEGV